MDLEHLQPPGVAPPLDPYSHAVLAGTTLFIAGQVAFDEANSVVGVGDPRRQAEQCWKNLQRVVESAGGRVGDIVKITIFLKDIRHAPAEMDVRKTFFEEGRFPICTQVQVANLALGDLLMEIDAIAIVSR